MSQGKQVIHQSGYTLTPVPCYVHAYYDVRAVSALPQFTTKCRAEITYIYCQLPHIKSQ